jgi:ubiquinone/menaquinone biosynthesis C-methylase UbiE
MECYFTRAPTRSCRLRTTVSDAVIAPGGVHHLPDLAAVIGEMTRVARLGVMINNTNRFASDRRQQA